MFSLRYNNLFCHEIDVIIPTFLAMPPKTFIDPYEQKLFHLFSSHENANGLIDLQGLNKLVHTLQLKERGSLLINLLLKSGSRSGVTFIEFREALLRVITSEDDGKAAEELVARRWWSCILDTILSSLLLVRFAPLTFWATGCWLHQIPISGCWSRVVEKSEKVLLLRE